MTRKEHIRYETTKLVILPPCKDAKEMWDLRSKIRVQQLPLFKYLQLGDVKIGIFVSTRLERLKYKQTQFLALRCHKRYDMHADTGFSVGKGCQQRRIETGRTSERGHGIPLEETAEGSKETQLGKTRYFWKFVKVTRSNQQYLRREG